MTTTRKPRTLKPCACRFFTAVVNELVNDDGEFIDVETTGTGCIAVTKREFAQGHDARLKSFLIINGALGREIRIEPELNGDGTLITTDAVGAADRYGFAHMVKDGIAREQARRQAAQERADAKHAKQAAKAEAAEDKPLPALKVVAKVGRWFYEGTIDGNTFTYTDKQGETHTTDHFTLNP